MLSRFQYGKVLLWKSCCPFDLAFSVIILRCRNTIFLTTLLEIHFPRIHLPISTYWYTPKQILLPLFGGNCSWKGQHTHEILAVQQCLDLDSFPPNSTLCFCTLSFHKTFHSSPFHPDVGQPLFVARLYPSSALHGVAIKFLNHGQLNVRIFRRSWQR